MSWFNSSLNSLKGQISNFAQEVLAENPNPEEELDVAVVLEEAHRKNEELSSMCAAKESEITSLRKQISDLLAKNTDNNGKSSKSALAIDKNASLEDSWCWEPDNIPSESSGKNDHEQNSESSSGGGELIAIPLDSHSSSHESEIIEKYQRYLDDRDNRLKLLTTENSALSEKISKLTDENVELQSNLEELDNQHNVAMKEVLDLKNDWQNKWTVLNNQQKKLAEEHELKEKTHQTDYDTLQKKFESIQSAYALYVQENEVLKLELEQLKGDVVSLEHEKAISNEMIEKNKQLEGRVEELVAKLDEVETQRVELQSQISNDVTKKCKDEDGFIVLQSEDLSGNNFEQKYNVVLAEKAEMQLEINALRKDLQASKESNAVTKLELENNVLRISSELENLKTRASTANNELEISQYKTQVAELRETMKTHESHTAELECKLKTENLNLQQQIIDLESSINKSNVKSVDDHAQPTVGVDDLNEAILTYTKIESPGVVDKSSLETVFKAIGDKVRKVEILEKNLKEMAEEVLQLKSEKAAIDHDKTTLQADIEHYEVECAELMKNNEILLNELENYRKNKLETIPENNEEGIIMMEKQLDDSNSYIRKLEDDYNDAIGKLIQADEKRYEVEDIVDDLQESNTQLTNDIKTLKQQLELLEIEKSNLVFEINEMKTDDKRSVVEMEIQENKHKYHSLLGEYELLKEHSEIQSRLVAKNQQEVSTQKTGNLQYTIESLTSEKLALENEVQVLQSQIEHYELKCTHLKDDNDSLRRDIEEMQAQQLTSSRTDEVDVLKRQLEEAQSSLKCIEDRYDEIAQRLMDAETQNNELRSELVGQQDNNTNLMSELLALKTQVAKLDTEKNNLVFEVNELRTDDNKSEAIMKTRLLDYESNIISLEAQLDRLSKDHADLVTALQAQKSNFSENRKKSEDKISFLEKALMEKEQECRQASETLKGNEQLMGQQNHEIDELKARMRDEHEQSSSRSEDSLTELNQLKQQIESLVQEKTNLIGTITTKHNENTQYYQEIQRLSQLLQLEAGKSNMPTNCEKCQQLQETLEQNATSHKDEIEKLRDQTNFLKEKSDILTSNLMSEQSNQRLLMHEKSELADKNASLQRDLERLREHLVEMEEAHTRETLELQNSVDDTKAKMLALQNEVSNSSNAYTSASIRATQHAETLQTQYLLVCQQRDEYAAKLSGAEDKESKNQAALINLQCALEQFQKEKEANIQSATLRLRKELQNEQDKQNELQSEIKTLNGKLADANQGLLAAARLSDQLEACQVTIASLREEIAKKQEKIEILEDKLKKTQENQADKVEKNLVKSLLIGYIVSANPNDKNQILKLIATVLDFNASETDKVGLNKTQSGWLTGFLHGGGGGGGGGQTGGPHSKDSLVQAFVTFLEKESQPRPSTDNLPILPQFGQNERRLSTASLSAAGGSHPQRKLSQQSSSSNPSAAGVQPILLNEHFLEQYAPSRNSSSILKDILSSDP